MQQLRLFALVVAAVLSTATMTFFARGAFADHIPPDLTVSNFYNDDRAAPGEDTYFHAVVSNEGGRTAVFASGTVVARMQFDNATHTADARCYDSDGYTCVVKDSTTIELVADGDQLLGVGREVYFYTYDVTAPAEGKITATATADPNGGIVERNETNNTATTATYVGPPPVDLALAVTDSADPVLVGDRLTYTLRVTNNSQDTAFDVVVEDIWPEGATFEYGWSSEAPPTATAASSWRSAP